MSGFLSKSFVRLVFQAVQGNRTPGFSLEDWGITIIRVPPIYKALKMVFDIWFLWYRLPHQKSIRLCIVQGGIIWSNLPVIQSGRLVCFVTNKVKTISFVDRSTDPSFFLSKAFAEGKSLWRKGRDEPILKESKIGLTSRRPLLLTSAKRDEPIVEG